MRFQLSLSTIHIFIDEIIRITDSEFIFIYTGSGCSGRVGLENAYPRLVILSSHTRSIMIGVKIN